MSDTKWKVVSLITGKTVSPGDAIMSSHKYEKAVYLEQAMTPSPGKGGKIRIRYVGCEEADIRYPGVFDLEYRLDMEGAK